MASTKTKVIAHKKAKAKFDKAFGNIVPSKHTPIEEPVEDEFVEEEDFISIPELKASKPSEPEESRVIYIGHLPFGFEEFQVADFFKQFGQVTRSYVSRSPKTGRSRGYAFVEFENPTVARIAADTMNDYLMFKKRLICRMVPVLAAQKIKWPLPIDEVTERTQFTVQRNAAIWYNEKNKTEPVDKFLDREAKKKEKLKKLGINYEFDGYTTLVKKLRPAKASEETKEKETKPKEDDEAKKRKRDEDQAKTWEQRKQIKHAADMTDKQKKKVEKKTAYIAQKEKRLANKKK